MKLRVIYFLLFLLALTGCKKEVQDKPLHQDTVKTQTTKVDTVSQPITVVEESVKPEEKITVLIVPISNGYSYESMGYDFNPVLDSLLHKNPRLEVLKFPYKKFNGSGFQGVNDKRYAGDILKKADANILIMSWYAEDMLETPEEGKNWGYHTKLLNTKTLEQKVSIGAEHLKDYNAIEQHIEKNVDTLVTDIIKLNN